ncbi:MAG: hypothetical protein IPK82_13320 [Polyangiaceae bacterium]|nr:hypothetical protein [Polyangiaceae bacterium]
MWWNQTTRQLPLLGALCLAACTGADPNQDTSGSGGTGTAGSGGQVDVGGSPAADPFEAQADTSEGLVNVSANLEELLEKGTLAGACDAYWAGDPSDRKAMLLCGKSMFFYESYGTVGVPTILPEMLLTDFEDIVGPGFSKLGMIQDPYSEKKLPLGLAKGAPFGNLESVAFTCASCHFGQLPDGRYAVGAANHNYEYGKHNLMMAVFPLIALLGGEANHDPEAIKVIQPLIDKVNNTPGLKLSLTTKLLPLASAGGQTPQFPKEAEHYYATWKSGTMDFLIEPLPLNDTVHTVSKISALWGVPSDAEAEKAGMIHAMLGFTGGTKSLTRFAQEFVTFGGGDGTPWTVEKVRPLVEYIESLRAPQNPNAPNVTLAKQGEALFAEQGCITCHSGPRGSGLDLYSYEEIGTDSAMKYWLDPTLSGEPCCNAPAPPDEKPTHQLKSPRLVGFWAMKRFLHNGSVDSVEALLCKNGPRGTITEPALGDGGHTYGCDLDDSSKDALIAYLLSH